MNLRDHRGGLVPARSTGMRASEGLCALWRTVGAPPRDLPQAGGVPRWDRWRGETRHFIRCLRRAGPILPRRSFVFIQVYFLFEFLIPFPPSFSLGRNPIIPCVGLLPFWCLTGRGRAG